MRPPALITNQTKRQLLPGLMGLIWPSAFVVQSIHVVARLGLADHLGAEPRTIDELAEATHVHAPSLRRVLRALTTVGVFAEDADGRIQHTGLSETLRADHPESVRAWALMLGAHFVSQALRCWPMDGVVCGCWSGRCQSLPCCTRVWPSSYSKQSVLATCSIASVSSSAAANSDEP
jgi:hypothetical protein